MGGLLLLVCNWLQFAWYAVQSLCRIPPLGLAAVYNAHCQHPVTERVQLHCANIKRLVEAQYFSHMNQGCRHTRFGMINNADRSNLSEKLDIKQYVSFVTSCGKICPDVSEKTYCLRFQCA